MPDMLSEGTQRCWACWALRVILPISRTFAPLWEVFRVSSDKLALCHLELTRKLQDLIKDVLRYSEEQLKMHKKVCAWRALPRRVGGGAGGRKEPRPSQAYKPPASTCASEDSGNSEISNPEPCRVGNCQTSQTQNPRAEVCAPEPGGPVQPPSSFVQSTSSEWSLHL